MTESPKMPELLPCERCGAKLEISKGGIYDPMYGWKCSECPIQARIRFSTVEEAITHANRLTPPPAPSTPASVGEADKILEIISIMSMAAQQSIDRPEYQYRPEAVLAGLGKIRELVSRHIQGKEG